MRGVGSGMHRGREGLRETLALPPPRGLRELCPNLREQKINHVSRNNRSKQKIGDWLTLGWKLLGREKISLSHTRRGYILGPTSLDFHILQWTLERPLRALFRGGGTAKGLAECVGSIEHWPMTGPNADQIPNILTPSKIFGHAFIEAIITV